jgi:hypothetical protein
MEMPQSIKHTAQAVSTRITLHSATLRLVKVESGIKGLLPTSWAPPIYSVSLLTKLRCALAGNGLLRLADVRSFLARICQMQKPTKMMKKSEKTRQGLYNVGFIGMRIAKAGFPADSSSPCNSLVRPGASGPLRNELISRDSH